ncbi:hypothetical protein [Pseudohongiella nitratireducens]|uniref:hypothetical protein n=1 Tax=Pseudohongiella nitratireducens TaxID=1768907 RepID=UPI0030EF9F8D
MNKLTEKVFTGELVEKSDAKGERYIQVNGLKLADVVDIPATQYQHSSCTNRLQNVHKNREQ